MRKMNRLHVAAALLMIVSVVSLLGISLAAGTSTSAVTVVKIMGVHSQTVTVWYRSTFFLVIPPAPYEKTSPVYYSWGRGRLHLLMVAEGVTGTAKMEIRVYGCAWNPAHTEKIDVLAQTIYLTESNPELDWSMDVPAHGFFFWADGPYLSKVTLTWFLTL